MGVDSGFDYSTIKYSASGERLWTRRYNGPGNGGDYAYALAVDAQGNVYVTGESTGDGSDYDLATIKYSPSGDRLWLKRYSCNGPGNGTDGARAIAVDSQGNVYVADTNNHRIKKFTSTGTYVTMWGSQGTANGLFFEPYGVAVDGQGNVYVADTRNHRIQKFTPSGVFLAKWGTGGTGNGQFNCPAGVAVDGRGNVYVTDMNNHRIQQFTSSGTFVAKWDSLDSYGLKYPYGVAVGGPGRKVYVADNWNHRLLGFEITGGAITPISLLLDE